MLEQNVQFFPGTVEMTDNIDGLTAWTTVAGKLTPGVFATKSSQGCILAGGLENMWSFLLASLAESNVVAVQVHMCSDTHRDILLDDRQSSACL